MQQPKNDRQADFQKIYFYNRNFSHAPQIYEKYFKNDNFHYLKLIREEMGPREIRVLRQKVWNDINGIIASLKAFALLLS